MRADERCSRSQISLCAGRRFRKSEGENKKPACSVQNDGGGGVGEVDMPSAATTAAGVSAEEKAGLLRWVPRRDPECKMRERRRAGPSLAEAMVDSARENKQAGWKRGYSSAGGAQLGDPLVELPRQVRHDAQLPLDQHQLRAMVHLMLL
jgi:hypothetical protein